jgi:nucleotide-binding universal stress UspA family protein
VVVVTAVFENLARTAARAQGFPALRMLVVPHPLEARPADEIRTIARARFADLVAMLTTG